MLQANAKSPEGLPNPWTIGFIEIFLSNVGLQHSLVLERFFGIRWNIHRKAYFSHKMWPSHFYGHFHFGFNVGLSRWISGTWLRKIYVGFLLYSILSSLTMYNSHWNMVHCLTYKAQKTREMHHRNPFTKSIKRANVVLMNKATTCYWANPGSLSSLKAYLNAFSNSFRASEYSAVNERQWATKLGTAILHLLGLRFLYNKSGTMVQNRCISFYCCAYTEKTK